MGVDVDGNQVFVIHECLLLLFRITFYLGKTPRRFAIVAFDCSYI
jgi:hypothetical protein